MAINDRRCRGLASITRTVPVIAKTRRAEMKYIRNLFLSILILQIALTNNCFCEKPEEEIRKLEAYSSGERVFENNPYISVEYISSNTDPILDCPIRAVTISKIGTIAILGYSTELSSYVISIFASNCQLLCRYGIKVRRSLHVHTVFFADENTLCYFVCHDVPRKGKESDLLILSHDGSGVFKDYGFQDYSVLSEVFGINLFDRGLTGYHPYTFVDKHSINEIYELTQAKLTIHNIVSAENIVVYDHEEDYLRLEGQNKHQRIVFILIVTAIIATVVMAKHYFRSKEKLQEEKNDSWNLEI